MNMLILVVDDEPDVEVAVPPAVPARPARRPLRWSSRNPLPWLSSASPMQATRALILILSDINMPGMSGSHQPGAFTEFRIVLPRGCPLASQENACEPTRSRG